MCRRYRDAASDVVDSSISQSPADRSLATVLIGIRDVYCPCVKSHVFHCVEQILALASVESNSEGRFGALLRIDAINWKGIFCEAGSKLVTHAVAYYARKRASRSLFWAVEVSRGAFWTARENDNENP